MLRARKLTFVVFYDSPAIRGRQFWCRSSRYCCSSSYGSAVILGLIMENEIRMPKEIMGGFMLYNTKDSLLLVCGVSSIPLHIRRLANKSNCSG